MATQSHLEELKTKHATLETKIKEELKSPQPDTLAVTNLKKQKLRLKEQIKSLSSA